MTDRTDLPRIKPKDAPTYFNKEAGLWGTGATLVGGIAVGLTGKKTAMAVGWGTTIAGTLYGAVIGKQRMEQEQKVGRVVTAPTSWNSGIWSGSLVAGFALAGVAAVAHVPGYVTLIAEIGGAIAGSSIRKKNMERDYNEAVGIRTQHDRKQQTRIHDLEQQLQQCKTGITLQPAAEKPISYKDSVTPDEAQALEDKQATRKETAHIDQVVAKEEQPDAVAARS